MRALASVGLALLVVALTAGLASADPIRVVVGFKGEASESLVTSVGGRVHGQVGDAVVATVGPAAIAKLRRAAAVSYVEADLVVETLGNANRSPNSKKPPKDSDGGDETTPAPSQEPPWGITRVGAPLTNGPTGSGIKVAVVDTGIDSDHPDLIGRVEKIKSFLRNSDDDNGHGTHVAGTIAANNNSIGVVGVAPDVNLFSVKVLDRRGSGWSSDVAAGIIWAADNGAHIINLSLGSSVESTAVTDACKHADAKGVLLIAAAGNAGDGDTTTPETSYPAATTYCIAVGATTSSDGVATFSNSGLYVDISAPGVGIASTWKGGGYRTINGTSMAAPHVAGIAALLWENLTDPTNSSVESALLSTTVDTSVLGFGVTRDDGYGYGIAEWTP